MRGGVHVLADCTIARESGKQLDRSWGWEAEWDIRVASLESAVAAVTLITAIIVVLWEIKIFYGL